MTTQPNILFVLIDCMRSRAIFDTTRGAVLPTVSQMLEGGTAFPTCVASATTTSPSVASIFTGTLPFVHGIRHLHDDRLNPEVRTLAEHLSGHGYHSTGEVTGPIRMEKGFARGFAEFRHRSTRESLYDAVYWSELQEVFRHLRKNEPWFLYLHLWEMHRPRNVPGPFDRRGYGKHKYERALSALDHTRLQALLELAGSDSIVVVTGDHGEIPRFDSILQFGKALRLRPLVHLAAVHSGHGNNVLEDQVLVPLLMIGPGIPQGVRVDTAIRHIDILPTILELAGVAEDGHGILGESLTPLFVGEGDDRPGYSEAIRPSYRVDPEDWLISVRHRGWKYVTRAAGSRSELWRLQHERRDVSNRHPAVKAELQAILTSMQSGIGLESHGENLSPDELEEVEDHLRQLGYLE